MKLIGFSVKNYRSISTAYKLPLTDYTVILGPNNEGKSNVLKALGLSLNLLTGADQYRFRRPGVMTYRMENSERFDYSWSRDFPINLQSSDPNGKTELTCEFELNETELDEFKKRTKVNLSTILKARLLIDKDEVKFDFLMKGRGKESLNKKKLEITQFINDKLLLQYIPAIRTSEIAIEIVEKLLQRELSTLLEKQEFREITKTIAKLQQPIIDKISKSLKESISSFIPAVKNISVKNRENASRLISTSCRVLVNDGIETDLQFKGDGIISLTAISLLQHFSKEGSLGKGLILLLEEPESHLHPQAIHNLKKVLNEISKANQVILTTHSPIIVERQEINHNIIVEKGKANPASNINEIRQSLGITMSDNLMSAYLVLLVEGEEDIVLLKPWLEQKSPKIKSALSSGVMVMDHLGGATNVGYKSSLYKNNLCNVIAYIDNDDAGRKGIGDAEAKGILKQSEYVLSFCKGMPNSEAEDLIDIGAYHQLIIDDYGVDLNIGPFRTNDKQWSDRVKEIFRLHGKLWKDSLESEIKFKVAKHASQLGLSSLSVHKNNSIDSLVTTIDHILSRHK